MKWLIVGFNKSGARSGITKDGREYSISESFILELLRETKDPTHTGLITKQVRISSDNAFYPLLQNSDKISFVGCVVNIETEGKYEKIVDFEFLDKHSVGFRVEKNISPVK